MRKFFSICLVLSILGSCSKEELKENVLDYVDPFVGTGFHGHTFPGVVLPNGMVQLSPDTRVNGWDASSGYHYSDSTILGFSHTHLSGTGIGDMGDILVLPFYGKENNELKASFKKENEKAEIGSYQVTFDNGISAELSSSMRAGFHQYHFPKGETPKLQFDLGHTLQLTWKHLPVSSQIEIIDDFTLRGTKVRSGWSYDDPVHFYAKFSSPIKAVIFKENGQVLEGTNVKGKPFKSFLTFDDSISELKVKVGISSVSQEGAQKNLEVEIDHWNIEKLKETAKTAWLEKFQKIEIETADRIVKTNFYTAMYHSMIAPVTFQDVDGQCRGMDKKIHQNKNGEINYTVFSMWDTFRALHPLLTIIEPQQSQEYVLSLLKKYEEGGILPKWPLSGNYTSTMVGYPAVSVIADAFAKGIVDCKYLDKALEASIFSSEYHPNILDSLIETRAKTLMGKPNKYANIGTGLIPADYTSESVSYGLEMAYYDWCISLLAEMAGQKDIAEKYQKRAKYYAHYFDEKVGFMRGKNSDGKWREPFSAKYSNHETGDYTEGNAYQWSWFVPHDVQGLIDLFGSEEAFSSKLDELFTASSEIEGEHASADITGLIGQYAHGNEPSHHTAFFYNYIGEEAKTQDLIDQILYELYSPTPEGICGNEDVGQMSAWYVLNALGFYQVAPGDPTYTIGRPIVDKAIVNLENGVFEIQVKNNSRKNKYVKSITLNGVKLEEPFFEHKEIRAGGMLIFEMTDTPLN